MNIREIVRTAGVTRWHIVRTLREQNVAEHMYLATMIGRDMARKLRFTPEQVVSLTEWLLIHDAPEALTGDLPTLTKMEIKKHVDFGVIEESTSREYTRAKEAIHGSPVEVLAKIADLMEGIIFLRMEGVRVDDPTTHPYHVLRGCTQAYRAAVRDAVAGYPGYPWHLLLDYREELDESPVRDLRNTVRVDHGPRQ